MMANRIFNPLKIREQFENCFSVGIIKMYFENFSSQKLLQF